jgi:putative DNA primase/helicase
MNGHVNITDREIEHLITGKLGEQAEHRKRTAPRRQHFQTTQLGNAKRLVSRYGNELRYCHAWKKWLIWNGRQWRADETGRIYGLAKETVLSIYTEAKRSGDAIRERIAHHASKSESRYEIESMISLAQSELPITPGELDNDPFLFNCLNGTLDLHTGQLLTHKSSNWLSKISPVSYDQAAECPNWVAFLGRIFGGSTELISFLQQAIGYSLTGSVSEKGLFVFHGNGDNGKTTLLEAVRHIMGDYAGVVDINSLMQSQISWESGSSHRARQKRGKS